MKKDKLSSEEAAVRNLAEMIGYGNMMNIASRMWRKKLGGRHPIKPSLTEALRFKFKELHSSLEGATTASCVVRFREDSRITGSFRLRRGVLSRC